jgi:hypothetical protein
MNRSRTFLKDSSKVPPACGFPSFMCISSMTATRLRLRMMAASLSRSFAPSTIYFVIPFLLYCCGDLVYSRHMNAHVARSVLHDYD